MEEERSPTKSDYDSSYPVRPSMSRSSSVSSFLGRQGFDRYGDEWGGGALTLIGELRSSISTDEADGQMWLRHFSVSSHAKQEERS
jgi:hypothetical protein